MVDKEMGITTTQPNPVSNIPIPAAPAPSQGDLGAQRGRGQGGRPGYGRGVDTGGYRPQYAYGYTGAAPRPPQPHSAIPPPNSIVR